MENLPGGGGTATLEAPVQLDLLPPVDYRRPLAPEIAEELQQAQVILLSSSAGKDSLAMVSYVVRTAEELGIEKDRLVVAHADLGIVEWEGTRELAEEQAKHFGLRFEVVARRTAAGEPQDLLEQVLARGKWPSPKIRFCTSDQKAGPLRRLVTQLVRESGARPARVVSCMGLRRQESPARAKKVPWELDERQTNSRKIVRIWLPIHDWTTEQVWHEIRASGARHHWAYDPPVSMPRLSCSLCIFSPKKGLVRAGRFNRELLDAYCKVEEEIGHKFRVDVSMAEVKAAVEAGEDAGEIPDWTM